MSEEVDECIKELIRCWHILDEEYCGRRTCTGCVLNSPCDLCLSNKLKNLLGEFKKVKK